MLDKCYDVKVAADFSEFEFDSIGSKGVVKKVVRYTEINVKGFYNLGFGDKDPQTGFISDVTVTNNNDSMKVLATVAATLYAFTDRHPDSTIIATGSTEARTRLYRMGISSNLYEIENEFLVLGLNENNWEPFRKNVKYAAFLVHRKP